MPTITPSLFLNVKTLQTGDASPFFSSLTNTASPGPWARVSGPTAGTLRLYLVEPSDNAIPTRVDAGTNTLHLYAKARASDTDLALEIDFTKTADGDYFYYLASAADFSVSTDLWDETGKLDLLCDIIERTTGGADVNAWRTSLTLLRGVADGGSPSPQIYVKVTPQSLSVGEKTQVLTNLGGTTVGKAVFTAIDESAARTAIGAGTSSFDPAAPGPIGGTTPNTITATAITGGIFTNVIQSIGDSTAAKDSSGNTYFSWGSNVVTYKKLLFLEGSYPGTSTRLSDAGLSGGNVDENANYTETWNVDDATGAALLNSLQVSDSATNGGTVMGPAATTGFAQEWRDSSGDVIAKIDAVDGSFTNYANVTTTSIVATYASFQNFDQFTFAVTGNTSLEGTNTGDQTDVPGNAGGLKAGTSAGGEIQSANGTLCASWGAGNGANFTVAALAVTANTITIGGDTITFGSFGRTLAATTTAVAAAVATSTQGATITSAATVDLATATGKVVLITGTTAITALGTVAAGAQFILQFQDVNAQITHNATTLRCHAGKSMQFLAGESVIVTSLGGGSWTASPLHVAGAYRSGGSGSNSERFGFGSTAAGSSSVAVGYDAQAAGSAATAIGAISRASASSSTSIGYGTNVSGSNSVGVGTAQGLAAAFCVSVGSGAAISSGETGSVCIGYNAAVAASGGVTGEAVVIGREASGSNGRSTCVGFKATAGAVSATVIGRGAYAGLSHGVAIGRGAYTPAGGTNTVTLGYSGGDVATDVYFDSGAFSHYINQVTSETNTRTATSCRARLNGMAGADMAGIVGNMAGGDIALCGGQGTGTGAGGKAVLAVAPAGSSGVSKNALVDMFAASPVTGLEVRRTVTATVGNVTIDRPAGTANIAATGTSVVVTNSMVTASSIIIPVLRTADATARIAHVVPASGSFTITLTAAATGEVSIGWLVLN